MATKKVFTILSEYGFWGVELVGPMEKLEAAGYKLDFATPFGKIPHALPPSYDPNYMDPPLGYKVTTPEDAAKVKALEDSDKLHKPLNLAEIFPQRPYFAATNFLREFEDYFKKVKMAQQFLVNEYDAILLVGGSGPIIDMVNNSRVHQAILAFHKANKPIAAICYGVTCLIFARDFNERKSIIEGKHVTGHCLEYDYLDGTGFLNTDLNMGPPPYCLEFMLADAVGPQGQFHGNFGKETSVIVDYPFITARSLQCSYEFGDQLVNMLDNGLKRYGW